MLSESFDFFSIEALNVTHLSMDPVPCPPVGHRTNFENLHICSVSKAPLPITTCTEGTWINLAEDKSMQVNEIKF